MSKEVFCSLFAAWFDASGLTLEEVAGHFSTAPGTVSRWRAGHSAPAPPARSTVIAFVRQAAKARGEKPPENPNPYGGPEKDFRP